MFSFLKQTPEKVSTVPLLNHSINICKCHRSMSNNGTLKRNRAHLKICVLHQYLLSHRRKIQRLIVLLSPIQDFIKTKNAFQIFNN